MPLDVSHINLATVNFNTLRRDELRRIAILESVRGISSWSDHVTYPPGTSNKDDLIRGLTRAQRQGKFAPSDSTTPPRSPSEPNDNITIKARRVTVFLKGKGCGEKGVEYIAAEPHDDGRVRFAVLSGDNPEYVDDLDDYDNFWTTEEDLANLLAAFKNA